MLAAWVRSQHGLDSHCTPSRYHWPECGLAAGARQMPSSTAKSEESPVHQLVQELQANLLGCKDSIKRLEKTRLKKSRRLTCSSRVMEAYADYELRFLGTLGFPNEHGVS